MMYCVMFPAYISNIIIFFHFRNLKQSGGGGGGVQVMCPVSPMLAEACKSVEKAIEKCPQGMYSEIKYDGERIQLHKKGNDFRYVILLFIYNHRKLCINYRFFVIVLLDCCILFIVNLCLDLSHKYDMLCT